MCADLYSWKVWYLDSCLHLIQDNTCVLSACRTWQHLEHYARWCWWPHQPPIVGSPFASKVGARINVWPKSWNFSDQQSKQQQGPSLNAFRLFVWWSPSALLPKPSIFWPGAQIKLLLCRWIWCCQHYQLLSQDVWFSLQCEKARKTSAGTCVEPVTGEYAAQGYNIYNVFCNV